MAVRIQREVGGSLAEVLQTTVDTMRERGSAAAQCPRAVGRGPASAWVLIGLPLALALFMSLYRRDYLLPLVHRSAGHHHADRRRRAVRRRHFLDHPARQGGCLIWTPCTSLCWSSPPRPSSPAWLILAANFAVAAVSPPGRRRPRAQLDRLGLRRRPGRRRRRPERGGAPPNNRISRLGRAATAEPHWPGCAAGSTTPVILRIGPSSGYSRSRASA